MRVRVLHILELTTAVVCQTLLLAAGWGFFGAVFVNNPLIVPDYLAVFMHSRPTETTWITTLVATVLSIATSAFLAIAFKEALRHRIHKPMSLVHLNGGIALASSAFLINFRHLIPTLVTLVVFGFNKLLVSSWTTLLTPVAVTWNIGASGWELDLTTSTFESMLEQELIQSGAAIVRGNSSEIIDIGGVLSGIAAAEYSFGITGIFDFNGVKYNVSTGGVLPAAPSYGGATNLASQSNTGLAFAGGLVPTHLDVSYPNGQVSQGLGHNYILLQQGLTANVTCYQTNTTVDSSSSSSYDPIPVPLANGTTDYWLWAWNITGNCTQGRQSQQQYVTRSNSSTVTQDSSSGFISSIVCPYPLQQSGPSWQHFTVVTNASWKYSFLPLTVCAINPLITTSRVLYAGGVINTTVINALPLGSSNTNLTRFLAAIVNYQSWNTQGLTTNSIGDALYSIYVSASNDNSTNDVTELLLTELEQYWQGVIEFSGTFLRSAFSVYPRAIPVDAQRNLTGNETLETMGWPRPSRSETYGYTIIPITIVALITYGAVGYTLWHVLTERSHESFMTFDPSNPMHVIMASSARERSDEAKGNLEDFLAGFNQDVIDQNENLRVQLTSLRDDRIRFMVVGN